MAQARTKAGEAVPGAVRDSWVSGKTAPDLAILAVRRKHDSSQVRPKVYLKSLN